MSDCVDVWMYGRVDDFGAYLEVNPINVHTSTPSYVHTTNVHSQHNRFDITHNHNQ